LTITSPQNQHLKEIRKLRGRRRERERLGRFVAEGEDLLAAADAAGWRAVERYCTAGSGLPGTEVEPALLAGASELGSGTRTLAVYEERWSSAPAGPLCVYLHGVADPGNVGAILRAAEAFAAASVCLGPGCADPFSPKAVRASMGAIFTVPVARAAEGTQALPGVKVALVAGEGVPLHELAQKLPPIRAKTASVRRGEGADAAGEGADTAGEGALTLLIGSERHGLPDEVAQTADLTVHIPIANHSLNAAMAATVALYEVNRMARR
jgi:TrmH family RNA methyltransferase